MISLFFVSFAAEEEKQNAGQHHRQNCVAKIFCLLKVKRKKFQPISLFWLLEREVRIAVARRISLQRSNWNFKQGAPTCRSECWKPPRGRRVECTWRSGRARSRKPWNIQGIPKKVCFLRVCDLLQNLQPSNSSRRSHTLKLCTNRFYWCFQVLKKVTYPQKRLKHFFWDTLYLNTSEFWTVGN